MQKRGSFPQIGNEPLFLLTAHLRLSPFPPQPQQEQCSLSPTAILFPRKSMRVRKEFSTASEARAFLSLCPEFPHSRDILRPGLYRPKYPLPFRAVKNLCRAPATVFRCRQARFCRRFRIPAPCRRSLSHSPRHTAFGHAQTPPPTDAKNFFRRSSHRLHRIPIFSVYVGNGKIAVSQRARFIERSDFRFCKRVQPRRALYQHAVLRRKTDSAEIGKRYGNNERAGI